MQIACVSVQGCLSVEAMTSKLDIDAPSTDIRLIDHIAQHSERLKVGCTMPFVAEWHLPVSVLLH